jgi:CBS domain-containing protein
MPIGTIRTREVVVAMRSTKASEAARLMRKHHVGDVVVIDESGGRQVPCGIVTDRDIVVSVVAQGVNPESVVLGDMMSTELVVGHETDGVADTVHAMRTKGVRRLPIVDALGTLVGIVTADDLLALLTDEMASLTALIAREQRRELVLRR